MTLVRRIVRTVFYPMAHSPEVTRLIEAHKKAADQATERMKRSTEKLQQMKVQG